MRLKNSIFIIVIALSILSACGEKTPKEVKADAAEMEKAAAEVRKEAATKAAKIEAANKKVSDSLRKVDSLRQVKEHGHAH